MNHRWLVTLALAALIGTPAAADSFTVTIRVVDPDKNPVAKAQADLFWTAKEGTMTPASEQRGVTDAAGKAVLRIDDWNEKRPVLVLSADRTRGAIVGVSKADDGKEVAVTLGRTVRLKGKVECKELNAKPAWANTMVAVDGFRAPFTQDMGKTASFEFVLPVATYKLDIYGSDVKGAKTTVALSADKPVHDLGTIDLKASEIAKLKGKPAPEWIVSAVRGAKSGVKLADYRGKWVYIEFWGFW